MHSILLVEDEAGHSELIGRALEGADGRFQVRGVATIAEARALLESWTPDLALIDFRLPDGNGQTLVKFAAGRFPCVMLTAYGNERTAVEAIKAGALDYIVKSPETFHEMPRLAERALREWQHMQERSKAEARLAGINHLLLHLDSDFQENCRRMLDLCGRELGARTVAYGRFEEKSLREICVWQRPKDFPRCDPQQSPLCQAILQSPKDQPYILADFASVPGTEPFRQVGLEALTAQVIRNGDQPVGVLCAFFDKPHMPSEPDQRLFGILVAALANEEMRRSVKARLRESESRYRTLFELAPSNIAVLSDRGRILDVNSLFCERMGAPRQELIGRSIGDFATAPPEEIERNIARLLAGQRLDHEVVNRLVDGTTRHFELHETSLPLPDGSRGILSVSNDISDRKKVEEALERLATSSSSPDGREILQVLTRNLAKALSVRYALIAEVNDPGEMRTVAVCEGEEMRDNFTYNLAGSPCEGVMGGRVCVHVSDVTEKFPEDRLLLEMGVCGYMGMPLRDRQGCIFGLLAVLHDKPLEQIPKSESILSLFATRAAAEMESRRQQQVRENLEMQLRQAHKMEAIGTLAGGIAHDFNNILAGILGNAELIRMDLDPQHSNHELMGEILRAVHRARELVGQILTFSRQREQSKVVMQLWPVVREALKLLRASLPATIEIRTQADTDGPAILADTTQIHQVVINLCTNAAHAMASKGGCITVSVETIQLAGEMAMAHPRLKPGPYVRLSVSDTGHGMTRDTLQRIFDPFFTTKPQGQGTGLGLAVVHGIVQDCGGEVEVHSQPGQGTTFHLLFPVTGKEVVREPAIANAPAPPVSQAGTGQHVLYVDDEEAVSRLGARILERLGYKVTAINDPAEAIRRFQESPQDFHLVITDYTMPGMTGVNLSTELLRIRADIPIILNTGYAATMHEEEARRLGIRTILMKPFSLQSLSGAVNSILSQPPGS